MAGPHSGTITGPAGTEWVGNALDPTAATNVGINLESGDDNISIKWVRASGSIVVGGSADTLIAVSLRDTAGTTFSWTADSSYGGELDIYCDWLRMVGGDNSFSVTDWIQDNQIVDSRFYVTGTPWDCQAMFRTVRRLSWLRNNTIIVTPAGTGDAQVGPCLYNVVNSTFKNNRWQVLNNATYPTNAKISLDIRDQQGGVESGTGNDNQGFLVMVSDTFFVQAPNAVSAVNYPKVDLLFTNGGSNPGACGRNRYDSLLVIGDVSAGGFS